METKNQDLFIENDNLFLSDIWQDEGITVGFTSRRGGVSCVPFDSFNQSFTVADDTNAVRSNRRRLAHLLETEYEQWIFAEQLHTNHVEKVTSKQRGAGSESFETGISATDGLYTGESNLVLATFHADCTPVYFLDKKSKNIGVVHAGWQGTVKEITLAFLQTWAKEGVNLEDVQVIIGPSAQQAQYEIGQDVEDQVRKMHTPHSLDAILYADNTMYLDVPMLNYQQVIYCGVPKKNISMSKRCTIRDEEDFFSYRRDGATGRMLAFIVKNEKEAI